MDASADAASPQTAASPSWTLDENPVNWPEVDKIVDLVLEVMGQDGYFTESDCIQNSVYRIVRRIWRSFRGKLRGNKGNDDLLFGNQGVGKTSFLMCLQKALPVVFGDRLTVIYKHSSDLRKIKPTTFLTEECGIRCDEDKDAAASMSTLSKQLKKHGRCCLLLIDEFQDFYKSGEFSDAWITTVYHIADRQSRTHSVLTIICGSKAWLRPLVFRKADQEKVKDEYPLYQNVSLSLNHQRFTCHPFDCLDCSVTTLQKYLRFIGNDMEHDAIQRLFAATAGNIRLVDAHDFEDREEQAINHDLYAFKALFASDLRPRVLGALWKCVERRLQHSEIVTPEEYLRQVPWNDLKAELGSQTIDLADLYRWADEDMISMTEDDTFYVGFRTPAYALMAQSAEFSVRPSLSSHLQRCLMYPYSRHGIQAEEAAAHI